MKLGKALATGVAEERTPLPEETARQATGESAGETVRTEPAAPAREEVPAAR
ncbi:hypothetical protein ACWCV9_26410 [Streptomyces sp. NPDC001606]